MRGLRRAEGRISRTLRKNDRAFGFPGLKGTLGKNDRTLGGRCGTYGRLSRAKRLDLRARRLHRAAFGRRCRTDGGKIAAACGRRFAFGRMIRESRRPVTASAGFRFRAEGRRCRTTRGLNGTSGRMDRAVSRRFWTAGRLDRTKGRLRSTGQATCRLDRASSRLGRTNRLDPYTFRRFPGTTGRIALIRADRWLEDTNRRLFRTLGGADRTLGGRFRLDRGKDRLRRANHSNDHGLPPYIRHFQGHHMTPLDLIGSESQQRNP